MSGAQGSGRHPVRNGQRGQPGVARAVRVRRPWARRACVRACAEQGARSRHARRIKHICMGVGVNIYIYVYIYTSPSPGLWGRRVAPHLAPARFLHLVFLSSDDVSSLLQPRRRGEPAPRPSVGCWRQRTRRACGPGRLCSWGWGEVLGGRRIGPLGMGRSQRHGRLRSGTNPKLHNASQSRRTDARVRPNKCRRVHVRARAVGRPDLGSPAQARNRSSQLHFQT